MKSVGLTGGIGTGKSTVGRIIREQGITVLNADEIGHRLMEPDGKAYREVVRQFRTGILNAEGQINRRELGRIIFDDDSARQRLEKIMHPLIIQTIKTEMKLLAEYQCKLIFVEVPLLFEIGMEALFDSIWVVGASPEIQLNRLKERDCLSDEEARLRMATQIPLDQKEARADVVIRNNGSHRELEAEIIRLLKTLE
jgi:dephospho-CoA kinase